MLLTFLSCLPGLSMHDLLHIPHLQILPQFYFHNSTTFLSLQYLWSYSLRLN
jgi:hypothetical protein